MAIMWQSSLVPWLDPSGAPYSGAKAYFFDAGTTTPRTVYRDSDLGESHDHPVLANASGMFPAVFLPPGDYRLRVESAAGVTLWDVDGISTPTTGESGGGGGGDTPTELLFRTGFYIFAHSTASYSGWVRANGRTIGNASSGATERANADCEALFAHLWNQDATLTVSGGRGANAASDWAASKTITLPDGKLRGLIGMASMGGTTATRIPASAFDGGENGDILGATVGAGTVTLTVDQLPSHNHGGTTGAAGSHNHTVTTPITTAPAPGYAASDASSATSGPQVTSTAPDHSHTITAQGGGAAHNNVQPSMAVTMYIKL